MEDWQRLRLIHKRFLEDIINSGKYNSFVIANSKVELEKIIKEINEEDNSIIETKRKEGV